MTGNASFRNAQTVGKRELAARIRAGVGIVHAALLDGLGSMQVGWQK